MHPILQLILGVSACAFWVWLMFSRSPASSGAVPSRDDVIDPNNAYQIGYLLGMTGGNVSDAAIARYAIQRFEDTHGYKPTLRDAAVVVGFMNTWNSL